MISTTAQLKKRMDALAPKDYEKVYNFLKSSDYANKAARDMAAAELKKNPRNIVIMQDLIEKDGTVRWKKQG